MAFVNGGCVVVGKPHPRHPSTKPHPIVYKIAKATRKKLLTDENPTDESSMFAR